MMKNQLKSLLVLFILAGFAAQYAAAGNFNRQVINQQNTSVNQQDMAFAFGDSAATSFDTGQMDLLSSQEMITTEGKGYRMRKEPIKYYQYRWGRSWIW
jgi:hypothetical protein